jgi:hypothetical protein
VQPRNLRRCRPWMPARRIRRSTRLREQRMPSPSRNSDHTPRASVAATAHGVDGSDLLGQLGVAHRAGGGTRPRRPPVVEAAGPHAQHPAHDGHRVVHLLTSMSSQINSADGRSRWRRRPRLFPGSPSPCAVPGSPDAA